jgi:hypothetical protein
VPQLTGPDSVLSLEGLTREQVSFTFKVDTAPLAKLDGASVDAVFAALAADPNWRVTMDGGSRVAWRRSPADQYVVGVDGWRIAPGGCSRVGVREGRTIEPSWSSSPKVARVPAGQALVAVDGFRPDGGVCIKLATAIRIDGALGLELFEAAGTEDRPLTKQILGEVPYVVLNVVAALDAVEADGFDPLSLPEKEPLRISGPTLVVTAAGPGEILIRGRVNPGETGWSWIRLVAADGTAWEPDLVGRATLEQPGWSHDPSQGFYLQSTVPAPTGTAFQGTVELWFQGEDGPPRLLHSDSARVTVK